MIGFLMIEKRLSFFEALTLVQTARPKVLVNRGFQSQLRQLQQILEKDGGKPNPYSIAKIGLQKSLLGAGFVIRNRNPSFNLAKQEDPDLYRVPLPPSSYWSALAIAASCLALGPLLQRFGGPSFLQRSPFAYVM